MKDSVSEVQVPAAWWLEFGSEVGELGSFSRFYPWRLDVQEWHEDPFVLGVNNNNKQTDK